MWRIKTNEWLDELLHRRNIIRFVESQRLIWLGRVERMPKEREVTRPGERNPKMLISSFLLCLLIPLHVSASRCHLQGVTVSLFIS
jgi:hypothetical protein